MSRLYVIGTSISKYILLSYSSVRGVRYRTGLDSLISTSKRREKQRSNTATKNRSSRHCTVATSCSPQLQVLPYIFRAFALSKHRGPDLPGCARGGGTRVFHANVPSRNMPGRLSTLESGSYSEPLQPQTAMYKCSTLSKR